MQSQRTCPNCGATVNGDQRFCSECGTIIDSEAAKPTQRAGEPAHTQYAGTPPPPPAGATPPPPPSSSYLSSPSYAPPPSGAFGAAPSQGRAPQPVEGSYVPPVYPQQQPQQQPQQGYQAPVPAYARAQRGAGRGVIGGLTCGVLAVILVILIVLGGVGYGVYALLIHPKATTTTNGQKQATAVPGTTPTLPDNVTPTAVPPQVVAFSSNTNIIYSTINITFTSIQQAQSFSDDSSSNGNPSTVRVVFKEVNDTAHGVGYAYSEIARLILPSQDSVVPDASNHIQPPASNATADNWLDFSVPTSVSIASGQLVLRLGTIDEAQMDIPLKANASLAIYQPKVITPPATVLSYAGLKWTLTKAVLSYSAESEQAKKGKRFVTVSVNVDNPSTSGVQGYVPDYIRMKAGGESSTPGNDTTIPTGFAAGTTGTKGDVSFMVPETATSFTFVLVTNGITGASQDVSLTFQIS